LAGGGGGWGRGNGMEGGAVTFSKSPDFIEYWTPSTQLCIEREKKYILSVLL
jgi:hypothetical protein